MFTYLSILLRSFHILSSFSLDCHAEIISRRCLVDFLYEQLEKLASSPSSSPKEEATKEAPLTSALEQAVASLNKDEKKGNGSPSKESGEVGSEDTTDSNGEDNKNGEAEDDQQCIFERRTNGPGYKLKVNSSHSVWFLRDFLSPFSPHNFRKEEKYIL